MARFWYDPSNNLVRVEEGGFIIGVFPTAPGTVEATLEDSLILLTLNGVHFGGVSLETAQDRDGNQLGQTIQEAFTALQAILNGPDTRPLYVSDSSPPATGSMLFIGKDGTAQAAPSSIVEDNIVFPSGTQFQQDALDIGNIARLCSVGSFINIKNRATGERFEIVDYQSNRANASTPASRLSYQATESTYTDIFTVTDADQVPVNERSFDWNANFTGRVWGLRFNFASAVTNLRIRLIDTTDEDNEQTVWTYPDNMAFLTGEGGSDHAAGVTEIDLGDSPLYAPITRSQRFELLADSGTITIDETSGNPDFGILRQVAERITLADANDDLALFEAEANRALEVRPAVLPVSDGPTPRPTYLGSAETPAELVVNAGNTNVITFLDMSEEFFDWTPTDDLRGFDVRFRRPNSVITNLRGRIENPDGEAIAYFPSAEAWFSGEGGTTLTAGVGNFTVATEHPFVVAANTTYRVRVRADGGQLRWQGPVGSDGQRNLYFATLAHTLETIELARLDDVGMGGADLSAVEDFALEANPDTPVPNDKIIPNYNETIGDTTLTVDNWPGYRNGVLRTSGSMLILHADIAEDGDRLCVHKIGSNTLTISSDDGNVTVNGEAMYEIAAEGKYDLIVRGQDWEVMVPQPTSTPVRYNRYLGTIGSSNADFTSFPEALENESVRATNAPGTVNGRFLSPQVEYRATQDTAANMPDNWDALPVFVSPDSGGPISITDLSSFGTSTPTIDLPNGYSNFRLVITGLRRSSGGAQITGVRLANANGLIDSASYQQTNSDGSNRTDNLFRFNVSVDSSSSSNLQYVINITGAKNPNTATAISATMGGRTSNVAVSNYTSGVLNLATEITQIVLFNANVLGTAYLYGDPDEAQSAQPGGAISTFSVTDPRNAIDFDLPSGYSNFRLVFSGVSISTASWDLTFIVGNDSNFITSGYNYRQSILPASTSTSGTIPNRYFSNRAAIDVTGALAGPGFTARASGEIRIFGARETDTVTDIHFNTIGGSGGGRNGISGWGETATNSGIVTRCRLAVAATAVNFTRGNFYLYGDPA